MITIYNKGMVICMGEPSQKDAEFVMMMRAVTNPDPDGAA